MEALAGFVLSDLDANPSLLLLNADFSCEMPGRPPFACYGLGANEATWEGFLEWLLRGQNWALPADSINNGLLRDGGLETGAIHPITAAQVAAARDGAQLRFILLPTTNRYGYTRAYSSDTHLT